MPDRMPNVLFLMSDEHHPDIAGFAGDVAIRTPTLDRLARDAVVFRNAYTPSPICIPGRQCMMSGQFCSSNGCTNFGQDLPPSSMTFARRLTQFGYRSACIGKLHHDGPDQLQGWTDRPFGDIDMSERFITEHYNAGEPRPAFASEAGTGKWSNQKEIERSGVAVGPYQHFDEDVVHHARRFIDKHFCAPYYDRPAAPRPLLLKVSLLQPHYPFFTDEERFTYYLNRVQAHVDEARFEHPVLSRTQAGPDVDVSARDARRATAAYYGMVDRIDGHYAAVLDALEHVGENLDDWLIIYTSDHGEMLGEHGIWEKTQFFEASARVPLIVRWPKRFAAREVTRNVNLCDLFATLCECCDVPLPGAEDCVNKRPLDSRSLLPLLEGREDEWDRAHPHDETVSQIRGTDLMIKRGALKYLRYERDDCRERPDWHEVLFDLSREADESRNLIGEERYAEALAGFRARADEPGGG